MPEGDTLHRVARRLQVLVGERLEVEAPHPRARAAIDATQLDGRRLEAVEAVGKNLVLLFEGGVVLRSHLRLSGRWSLRGRGEPGNGVPWLVLRGAESEAALWNGPTLRVLGSEEARRFVQRLGPDILASPPDFDAMLERLERADGNRFLGDALQDQSLVAGIGNMWMAETLWRARVSPWVRLRDLQRAERRRVLETAAQPMRAAVEAGREPRKLIHGRSGRACPRCGTPIRAWGQGEANRTAFWCSTCQVGEEPPFAY